MSPSGPFAASGAPISGGPSPSQALTFAAWWTARDIRAADHGDGPLAEDPAPQRQRLGDRRPAPRHEAGLRRPRPDPAAGGQRPGPERRHARRGSLRRPAVAARASASSTGSTTSWARAWPSWPWCAPPPGSRAAGPSRPCAGPASWPRRSWPSSSSPTPRACWPSTAAAGRLLVLATTSPADLVAPFAELLGFDDVARHPLRAPRRAVHRRDRRATSSGPRASWRRSAGGRRRRASTWPRSHAYSDSVFDLPLLRRRGPSPRGQSRPPPATPWPGCGAGRSSTGTGPRGCPRWAGSSPTTCCARSSGPRLFPYAALRHRRRSSTCPAAAGHPGRPTTAATSTWSPWPSWPPGWVAPCASWPSGSSSTRRSSGQLARALGGIPRRPGQRLRHAAARRPARPSRPVRWSSILPQGTIPRGEEFFDPVLQGKTGTARLAAMTGAPSPHRAVGDRGGVAPVGPGPQHHQPAATPRPCASAWASPVHLGPRRRRGRHRGDHGGHHDPASRRGPPPRTSPRPRSWPGRSRPDITLEHVTAGDARRRPTRAGAGRAWPVGRRRR